MSSKHENILGTVGRTPVVRLSKLAPPHVKLYAKVEAFNPGGSVKDRLALGVIEDAERTGKLRPGQTVIEATSGNTGIGLAIVCAQKGYPLVVTMAESFSVERRKLMRFLGAKVVLTPAAEKGTGMLNKAVELAEKHDWFLARQFENEANANIHSQTTAREILEDFENERLDYWVSGFGTGGTVKGVSRVLKAERPETQIVVCEPDNSQLLGSGTRQQRDAAGAPAASHASFRPHVMQGWTPDFISKLTEDAVDGNLIDQVVPVAGDDAMRLSRELAQKEGILVGISAGATLAGALRIAEQAPEGSTILCMLPDTGERYLSTPLFEDVAETMTDEELEISRSTPSARFDISPQPAKAPAPAQAQADAEGPAGALDEAADFFEAAVTGDEAPVVMFALEWCEFCWSARRLLTRLGVPFRSIDLDSVEYQKGDFGGRVRRVLNAQTGCVTIPQIFVGGEFVGGCTELFDAYNDGSLAAKLAPRGVDLAGKEKLDPYGFLPKWLQPRTVADAEAAA